MAQHIAPTPFTYEGILQAGMISSAKMMHEVRKLRFTPQDVLVAAYPKTGIL